MPLFIDSEGIGVFVPMQIHDAVKNCGTVSSAPAPATPQEK